MDENNAWLSEVKDVKPIKRNRLIKVNNSSAINKKNKPREHQGTSSWTNRLTKSNYHHRIDLHGLTKDEAFDLLYCNIKNYYLTQERVLLVITGKGTNSKPSILKNELPRWLSESKISQYVLETNFASSKDGGSGARYVILKKLR